MQSPLPHPRLGRSPQTQPVCETLPRGVAVDFYMLMRDDSEARLCDDFSELCVCVCVLFGGGGFAIIRRALTCTHDFTPSLLLPQGPPLNNLNEAE